MTILETLSREDLYLWRRVVARWEVVQSGSPALSAEEATEAVVSYFETFERFCNDYCIPAGIRVDISPIDGAIREHEH